ncbi:MAG: MBL fold metallo-hydrolase [Ruminococcaceae bacterium]|nr:MBL fold metallo-hydrolase [Oscillospiraceae bacterium]
MKRIISVVLLLILSLTLCSCGRPISDDSCLCVYFFDVGQADSSLLLFPDGVSVLIDAGNQADGKLIADYLKKGGIDTLDYLICTHPHEDHIGGTDDIFDNLKISNVCLPYLDSEFYNPTNLYNNLLSNISNEGSNIIYLNAGSVLLERSNYSIEAIAPGKDSVYSDLNDYSICLLVDYYTNTILFTGDAEERSETEILGTKKNIDADILKVGHHGSSGSSSKAFLEAVTPQVAIISCGKGNSYGHPNKEALTRLEEVDSKIYRTDTVGTVIAKLYDGGFNIETDSNINLDGNN